ncbi:serine hydrolase domain-containing protein [Pseudonocardia spinosispora]|uniref:serine hydrolase domain-containing protein n=1 Tax=Pseudonocardia spinosispora TaxID=103441 RepID=UPI0004148076|nr:serine hydrolase domain-containing protein [Pseudonocardia spinosispora]
MTTPATSTRLEARLERAVQAVDAPDVVFAVSHRGRRTVRGGGTGPPRSLPRELARYELGSASKTFAGLLLAHAVQLGRVSVTDPAARYLAGAPRAITLEHLITHTSGLPPLPGDFWLWAVPHPVTNPYARYPADRVIRAFLRCRPRRAPATVWRYSNFGVAVFGHTLVAALSTPWASLLGDHVLRPLALTDTGLVAQEHDAIGHRADGRTPTPPIRINGFAPAGGVRATPHDMLSYLEAHLDPPAGLPSTLRVALTRVLEPAGRHGEDYQEIHTRGWFRHDLDTGPVFFHGGGTLGQQAFLGFRPDTRTALAAFSTRRYGRDDTFQATAYDLLTWRDIR